MSAHFNEISGARPSLRLPGAETPKLWLKGASALVFTKLVLLIHRCFLTLSIFKYLHFQFVFGSYLNVKKTFFNSIKTNMYLNNTSLVSKPYGKFLLAATEMSRIGFCFCARKIFACCYWKKPNRVLFWFRKELRVRLGTSKAICIPILVCCILIGC